ncbi:MAG: hypothetical protein ABI759_30860 [Candidatus Solibacter sp.]
MALLNSVPMRWPGGPLDVAIRSKAEGFTPQARQVLEHWQTPAALDILQGSQVNCLVVNWAAGLSEDAAQQGALRPLIQAARGRNLEVVGWVAGKVEANAAIGAAKEAGLSAVAVQNFQGQSDFPVIPWGDRAHAPFDTKAPVLPVTDNVWPGVAGRARGASAGPTAVPWLDSNGWYVQLARARTNAQVWIVADPPGKNEVIPARSYTLAVCDSATAGGRWVISLDDALRGALSAKEATAGATMKSISDAIGFFDKHREWQAFRSLGVVGVMSDFSPDNYDFASEVLNLASRRDMLFRVLSNPARQTPDLTGLKAALWADTAAPPAAVVKRLVTFVEQGGLLVTGPGWGAEGKSLGNTHERFDVRTLGKGRIAVSKAALADPWEFVVDAELLLSHANNVVKLFNASASGGFNYSGSPDGKRALVQLLSYSTYGRASEMATAWTRHKYRSARFWTMESAQPVAVPIANCEDGGTEYHLPGVPAYTALELEA